MQVFKGIEIEQIKKAIEAKKQNFDIQWLGKSLAYTPYQPRPLDLKREDSLNVIYSLANSNDENFLFQAKELEKSAKAFIIESLEIATYLRRYISVPLVYDFLILDSYQLLEALVYGTDSVMLYPKYLEQKTLKELSQYALKLGLERIFCIESKEDLTKAIFAKADILNLNKNFSLIPLIPKQKILLSNLQNANPEIFNTLDARIL
ncbi:hypothetical protein IP360_03215 [Helicobacter winghamensis]|uniref:indole-3-glycerol-phosphate synthase n=1 Tax=Helicobacter winghamensis TaxID=157268 RepID=A0A2N3PIM8_9HELI|nr:hypothetical protein BCM35_05975 [Helicobacter winghamensis]PKT76401.1 hypothetical protein BCM32_03130 [Helicobacter winghamensis]PKT76532.1 hypothetical protein BCM34_04505 [Helicobacter winghamensis]PKT80781.1 hypothetical protein BCM31_02115 [Helicobacter winghamensis]PKT81196.1 hypothetical protein BCM33_04720 [Helicobacter winghamensis]